MKATGGTAEDAAEIAAIFNKELQTQFLLDVAERTRLHGPDAPTSLLPRTDAQRRFDAIQAIFRRSTAVPAGSKPPKPLVNIIIDQRSFEETLFTHGYGPDPVDLADIDPSLRRSETSTGTALIPDAVLKAALGGHVRRIVVDSAGVVINMGRKQRLFTGAAREAAKLMAHRCDFRGCDVPATYAEVDHLNEWQRDDGQIIYHRPNGTPILPVGQRPPPETHNHSWTVASNNASTPYTNTA